MEENKNKVEGKPEKLSYEKLNEIASNLHVSNQKLYARVQELQEALSNREFEYTSFFLTMLFKVVEHAEMYNQDFVDWTIKNIEDALRSFMASVEQTQAEEKTDGKAE